MVITLSGFLTILAFKIQKKTKKTLLVGFFDWVFLGFFGRVFLGWVFWPSLGQNHENIMREIFARCRITI